MPPTSPSRPSTKQLAYLKTLAQRTATSFTYPHDRAEASREIERLRRLPAARRTDRGDELEQHAYGTAPELDEIRGYCSSATWRHQAARR
jgi:hypothetical protein